MPSSSSRRTVDSLMVRAAQSCWRVRAAVVMGVFVGLFG